MKDTLGAGGIIDFHAHVVTPDVYARTVNYNVVSAFGRRPMEERPGAHSARWPVFSKMVDPDIQLDNMDALGIAQRVISTSTVSQSTFFAPASVARVLDRQGNESIADWVRKHPKRFIGTFTLPLQDMNAALEELEYAVVDLGLRIANLPAASGGRYLGDPYFDPLWECLEARAIAAFIHPDGIKDPAFQEFSLWNAIGQGIEETRAMASLIYGGTFDRYPNLQIIMAHAGGYLPGYIGRLDRNATAHPASVKHIQRKPSDYLRNFLFDTVTYDPFVIRMIAERVGVDRLLFGTDYPFGDKDPLVLICQCGFDPSAHEAITSHNALMLLQRSAAPSELTP